MQLLDLIFSETVERHREQVVEVRFLLSWTFQFFLFIRILRMWPLCSTCKVLIEFQLLQLVDDILLAPIPEYNGAIIHLSDEPALVLQQR